MATPDRKRLMELGYKWIEKTISPEEKLEFEQWLDEASDEAQVMYSTARSDEEYEALLLRKIREQAGMGRTLSLWPRVAAAAAVLLLIGTGAYFLLHQPKPALLANNDVAPFSKQAILKTGHGKTLILNSTHQGTLALYANTQIRQAKGEQIAYTNNDKADETVVFDTLQVPAGGRPYHLQLADGSRVVLNVASALRFPENFRKNNNEVELIMGEAYFSIRHQARSPLTIKAKDQLIEDIGTEFNVNTYGDEPDSRTTLVEGAVKVNHQKLLPGQQAVINGSNLNIAQADIRQTIAWTKGDFIFNGEHIQAVMRELARWYNIEVLYQGKPTETGFYIRISRSKNISQVLKMLERTNSVHFKIEGRRVTVFGKK